MPSVITHAYVAEFYCPRYVFYAFLQQVRVHIQYVFIWTVAPYNTYYTYIYINYYWHIYYIIYLSAACKPLMHRRVYYVYILRYIYIVKPAHDVILLCVYEGHCSARPFPAGGRVAGSRRTKKKSRRSRSRACRRPAWNARDRATMGDRCGGKNNGPNLPVGPRAFLSSHDDAFLLQRSPSPPRL